MAENRLYLEYNKQTDNFDPACERSKLFTILAKKKQLTDKDVGIIYALGFTAKINFEIYNRKQIDCDFPTLHIWPDDDKLTSFTGQFRNKAGQCIGQKITSDTLNGCFMKMINHPKKKYYNNLPYQESKHDIE